MPLVVDPGTPLELDTHTLRIVRAIADLGSMTAAAAALGYSQPAISPVDLIHEKTTRGLRLLIQYWPNHAKL